MAFWIFLFIMCLLGPITMIILGLRYMKKAPESINDKFGYRTSRSMKSQASWTFAHQYFGRLWLIIGSIVIPLSVIPMILVYGKEASEIGTVGGIIVMAQTIPLAIVPFALTERALKRNFDEFGEPYERSSDSKAGSI